MARSGGPLEPPSAGRWEVGLVWRRRRLRDEVPYRSMPDPTNVLAGALLGTGWLAVTVGGIRLGVRHHELRAETSGENPENPARWWPLPRHG
jgi:hypothetical protein